MDSLAACSCVVQVAPARVASSSSMLAKVARPAVRRKPSKLDGRRRLVRYLLDHPKAGTARESRVSVDVRLMKGQVRRGLSRPARARRLIAAD